MKDSTMMNNKVQVPEGARRFPAIPEMQNTVIVRVDRLGKVWNYYR
jgi:hypothetical protein